MDDERMIQEVQYHSLIYDTTHPFYKDNTRKERAWAEVAAALRTDVTECKTRWRNLRDTFVKHRKRLGLPNGSGGWPQKDWKYAELMSFLLPFVVPRASKRRRPASEAEGEQSSAPLSPAASPPPEPSQTPPPAPSQGLWRDRPRRSRSPRERAPSWAGQRPRVPESEWDEAYHFCLSTVPQLQRLSWRRRNTAKIEILRVLERLREEQEQQPPPCPRRVHRAADGPGRAAPQGPGVQTVRAQVKEEPEEQGVKQEVERPPEVTVCVMDVSAETHSETDVHTQDSEDTDHDEDWTAPFGSSDAQLGFLSDEDELQ